MSRKQSAKSSSSKSTNASASEPQLAHAEPWPIHALALLTIALLMLVLMQCVVGQLPDLYFDTDPRSRSVNDIVVTFGATGTAWLSTLCVFITIAILFLHPLAGGTIDWVSLLLAIAGILAALHHLPRHTDNVYTLGSWIGAACVGIAAVHVGQFLRFRRWIIAALIAMLLPLGIASISYVLVEHPMTLDYHQEHLQEFLKAHNWTEESPQYQLYLRRLKDPQVTGVFGLSNVFGSILAAMTAAVVAIVGNIFWQTWTGKNAPDEKENSTPDHFMLRWKWLFAPLGVLALGSVSVVLTRSKGAAAGLVIATGVMVLYGIFSRITIFKNASKCSRCALMGIIAILCVALPIGAVIYRGKTWHPTPVPGAKHKGDISLLVRAQYWGAALAMVKNPPASTPIHVENNHEEFQKSAAMGNRFWGLSPAGFSEAYLRYKSPLNPEEVSSTHNVFIDSIIMLGVGGLCWSALLLLWLWRGAGNCLAEDSQATVENPSRLSPWILPLVLAFGIFGTQYFMQWAIMASGAINWILGAVGFVLMVHLLLATPMIRSNHWRLAAFLAALVLLIHNQVEMAFFQVTSAPAVWLIVGLAGAKMLEIKPKIATTTIGSMTIAAPVTLRKTDWVLGCVLVMIGIVLLSQYTFPVMLREDKFAEAALQITRNNLPVATEKLDELVKNGPLDLHAVRWAAQMKMEMAQDLLRQGNWQAASEMAQSSNTVVDEAIKRGMDNSGIHRLHAQLLDRQHKILDQPAVIHPFVTAFREGDPLPSLTRVTWLTPTSISDWQDYTEFLDRKISTHPDRPDVVEMRKTFTTEKIIELYKHILTLSDEAYLDPAKQLSEEDRRRIEGRIAQLEMKK